MKTLTEPTRADNARFFDSPDDVPMHCITQGIGTILRARHLVLLAFGEAKAHAVAAAVEGPVSASQPGSAIQLHPHTTVVVDEAAASELGNLDYYRHAWAQQARVAGHLRRIPLAAAGIPAVSGGVPPAAPRGTPPRRSPARSRAGS